jgi:hypothetical protein
LGIALLRTLVRRPVGRVAFYLTTLYHRRVTFGAAGARPLNAPVEPAGTRSDRGLRVAVVLCTAVIILTGLNFTGAVFAPLAFAALIIAVMWPLQECRRGCPSSLRCSSPCAVLTLCAQHPSTQWIAELFCGPGTKRKASR